LKFIGLYSTNAIAFPPFFASASFTLKIKEKTKIDITFKKSLLNKFEILKDKENAFPHPPYI
jgi:hypothetical protein